jgi:hypothetical protein
MDIIKALQENEKPFGLMSEELKTYAGKIGRPGHFESFTSTGWIKQNGEQFYHANTYRLLSDYEEKPGFIECEIRPDENNHLWYYAPEGTDDYICGHINSCIGNPDFIGFKYEDGIVRALPRAYQLPTYVNWQFGMSDEYEVLTPTHVLFKDS